MSKMRSMSVILIVLSSAFSIVTGRWLDQSSGAGTSSYRAVYYGARCLLNHADPYNPDEFSHIYNSESGALPRDPARRQLFLRAVMVCVNLPTTLFLLIPLALLPWGISHVLWLALIAISLTVAAILAYDLSAEYDARMALVLICFVMANCQVLFTVANAAGIAVGLCVIAVWCFVRGKFAGLGVIALAISLALKPHDSGLVCIWLLVSGSLLRKRALQSAVLVAVIAAPAVLVVSHSAPQWRTELAGNLAATSGHGDISDPGPSSISRQGSADIIIDLQTALSLLSDHAAFYNSTTYLICGLLLVIVLVFAARRDQSAENGWFALAFLGALTMLVSYHRPYDAKLLLLAIPACAMLWKRRGRTGIIGSVLTGAAIAFTSDIPIAIHTLLFSRIPLAEFSVTAKLSSVLFTRPAPILLLAMSGFYLWAYLRFKSHVLSIREEASVC